MPMFGGMGGGIVETPEQRRLRERLEAQYGRDPLGQGRGGSGMDAGNISLTPGARQTLRSAPRKAEGEKPKGYWQGGDKFTGRDALAAGLAAIGDGFSSWANGPSAAGATRMLVGGRFNALDEAKKAKAAADAAAQRQADLQAAGIDPSRGRLLGDSGVSSVMQAQMKGPEATTFQREYEYILQTAGPEAAETFRSNKINPPVYRQGPDMQFYRVDTAPQAGGFDTLPEGYSVRQQGGGPQGQSPMQAPQQTPAPPITGARTINAQQYMAKLREFGGDQNRMNQWMAQNNIIAGN